MHTRSFGDTASESLRQPGPPGGHPAFKFVSFYSAIFIQGKEYNNNKR